MKGTVSVIIPVFNKWDLTRVCLKSLAATTKGHAVEVILVDNASTDISPKACPLLGRQLFGADFHYARQERNLNFGPASNLGAKMASGEFLLFLNNDTELLPGWLSPLLDDFQTFPDTGASGPLLLYPQAGPLGRAVQHLGVHVTPFRRPGHLYAGIPGTSPLARKRRFFQIITGACMLTRRQLFLENGMFDEGFVNGFEDVDLCARLGAKGLRMTVNPDSVILHHESQTATRHDSDKSNIRIFQEKSSHLLKPDMEELLEADALELNVTDFGALGPAMRPEAEAELDRLHGGADAESLKKLLIEHPYWRKGWELLSASCPVSGIRQDLGKNAFRLFRDPAIALESCAEALRKGERRQTSFFFNTAAAFCLPASHYAREALAGKSMALEAGASGAAARLEEWLGNFPAFVEKRLRPFMRELGLLAQKAGIAPGLHTPWARAVWADLYAKVSREKRLAGFAGGAEEKSGFSLLLPIVKGEPAALEALLASLLGQKWRNWELVAACAPAIDQKVLEMLGRQAARNARIRIKSCASADPGDLARAALDLAVMPWTICLDEDSLLFPESLALVARAIRERPEGDIFFCDDAALQQAGEMGSPRFLPRRWDQDLAIAEESLFAAMRSEKLRSLKGYKAGFAGAHELLAQILLAGAAPQKAFHVQGPLRLRWVAAKDASLSGREKAAQAALAEVAPGAEVYDFRGAPAVKYPLPEPMPLSSLVIDLDQAGMSPSEALKAFESPHPHEIIIISVRDGEGLEKEGVRILRPDPSLSLGKRLNLGARAASGTILGFFAGGTRPASEGWLEEMVTNLAREGVGSCAGMSLGINGRMFHAGWLAGADGILAPFLAGLAPEKDHYGWSRKPRAVAALDENCFFTRAEYFARLGGFSAVSMPVQDFCLRLGGSGLSSLWRPMALFRAPRPARCVRTGTGPLAMPFNEAVAIIDGRPCFADLAGAGRRPKN